MKKLLLLASFALAASTASANNLLFPGDVTHIECNGILFDIKRDNDIYTAKLAGKTFIFSEVQNDFKTTSLIARDPQGNVVSGLMFEYSNHYALEQDSDDRDSASSIDGIESFMSDDLKDEAAAKFKLDGFSSLRSAKLNTPLQITIIGIKQTLQNILLIDTKGKIKYKVYENCNAETKRI